MAQAKCSERARVLRSRVNRYKPLITLIRGSMYVEKVNAVELADFIGTCEATIYNRFSAPQEFRLKELEGIARRLKIPWNDIMGKLYDTTGQDA